MSVRVAVSPAALSTNTLTSSLISSPMSMIPCLSAFPPMTVTRGLREETDISTLRAGDSCTLTVIVTLVVFPLASVDVEDETSNWGLP